MAARSIQVTTRRKSGERYPCGKLKPQDKPTTPPAKIRRAVDMALAGAADPILGTAVGWLRLHTILTDVQVAAAQAFAREQGKYDRITGMPRRSAASPSYGAGFGGDNGSDPDPKVVASVKKRYARLREIVRRCGPRALGLMDRVCVEDSHPTAWELTDFISALNAVAGHLRIAA